MMATDRRAGVGDELGRVRARRRCLDDEVLAVCGGLADRSSSATAAGFCATMRRGAGEQQSDVRLAAALLLLLPLVRSKNDLMRLPLIAFVCARSFFLWGGARFSEAKKSSQCVDLNHGLAESIMANVTC